MANVQIVLAKGTTTGGVTGSRLPVLKSKVKAKEKISNPAASTIATTITTAEANVDIWQVTVTGGNIMVKFGTGTPIADADDDWLVVDGQTREWEVSETGEKCAVINA